ncbi:MAG: TIR domain-containing protein [Henriciella sp.]|uniref:TIR domain-containing protein n=1 Tax=Henriciella sp. TaxID=1968823 RepID=UPI003C715F71
MSGSQTTVFFSYSREDKARAIPIISTITDAGYSVWWDGMLAGGSTYLETTERALESARAVVVLWSDRSIKSHWVRDEATYGREQEKLVPLSIDGVQPPLGFRQIQFIDMDGWTGGADAVEVREMLAAIAALHAGDERPSKPVNAVAPAKQPATPTRRQWLIGAGGLALAGAAGVAAVQSGLFRPSQIAEQGIVVLPFKNLSGNAARDYISSGLSAEIRSTLARNPMLRVVAQTSSEAMRDAGLDAIEICRRLGVAYLLDGTVQGEGDSLRLTAELVDGRSGFSNWSKTFEKSDADLLTVQAEVADAVNASLTPDQPAIPNDAAGNTENGEAFDAYLQGIARYRDSRGADDIRSAIDLLDTATSLDPGFAAAFAAKGRAAASLASWSDDPVETNQARATALEAAKQAVSLAPKMADAHSTLGWVYLNVLVDVPGALVPFERSFELGQGDATVLARYSAYMARIGRDADALGAVRKAVGLDRLNPTIHRAEAFVHYAARRYKQNNEAISRALALRPELSDSHARIGLAEVWLGRAQAGLDSCRAERSAFYRHSCVAIAAWKSGDEQAAREAMASLEAEYGDISYYEQGGILAQWGALDEAMDRLNLALRVSDVGLTRAKVDPALDPLRSRPDFIQLLNSLGLS